MQPTIRGCYACCLRLINVNLLELIRSASINAFLYYLLIFNVIIREVQPIRIQGMN